MRPSSLLMRTSRWSRPVRDACGTGIVEDGYALVLTVAGDIDAALRAGFRSALDVVEFMESTGLNALVRAAQHAQQSSPNLPTFTSADDQPVDSHHRVNRTDMNWANRHPSARRARRDAVPCASGAPSPTHRGRHRTVHESVRRRSASRRAAASPSHSLRPRDRRVLDERFTSRCTARTGGRPRWCGGRAARR